MTKKQPAMSRISVLLPTRKRGEVMVNSVRGLVEKSAHPDHLEILFGIDADDGDTLTRIQEDLAPFLQERGVEARATQFEPMGYAQLHEYVNTLASASTGEWLFFWNDDAVMVTEGWDEEIRSHDGEFKLFGPTDNHNGHPYAIFPIVPRDWFICLDHLSQNAQNDAWLSQIAYMLDIFERLEFEVIHDRADITGNNNDETFAAREYQEGNPEREGDFDHERNRRARFASAAKLAWFMERTGRDTTWWERVKAGQQNPFEKMVAPRDVRGAGQLGAVDSGSEYDDDHTLNL